MSAGAAPAAAVPRWCGFHLYYHADLDRVLIGMVRPVLGELVAAQRIDRFFFVRYALGGPHIRVRLRASPGHTDAIRALLVDMAGDFFRRYPSLHSRPADEIRRINQSILSTDPAEHDDSVYPDNHIRECPFYPETARYGGAARLPVSLDYFALSSAHALGFVTAHHGTPRARLLPLILRRLLVEAAAMASRSLELEELLSAPFAAIHPSLSVLVDRGDRLFEERSELFVRLVQAEVLALLEPAPLAGCTMVAAGRCIAATLGSAPGAEALPIAASLQHMSANRLGLQNPEEIYLGRVLWRAATELRARAPSLWERIACLPEVPEAGAAESLRELAAHAIADPALYRDQAAQQ